MDEAPIDDALLDAWDAYLRGDGLGDQISKDDQEAISMLHTRAWSPVAPPVFRASLRSRLVAPAARVAPATAVGTSALSSRSAARPVLAPGVRFARRRAVTRRPALRAALAAAVILALLASFGDRLSGDPAPTVQAPVGFAVASPVSATPTGASAYAACPVLMGARLSVASVFLDLEQFPEIAAPLASARYMSIQVLEAVSSGELTPNSYYTSGVTGITVDTVVAGAARVRLASDAMVQTVTDPRSTESRIVDRLEMVDLVQGDSITYPVGALETLTNPLADRHLTIARVVLHDVQDLLAGNVSDTVTLRNLGRGELPAEVITTRMSTLVVSLGYVVGLSEQQRRLTPCESDDDVLVVEALQLETYDDGTRYSGYLGSLGFFHPAGQ